MAMVFCRECGAQISDAAETCPSCGAPAQTHGAYVKPGYLSFHGRISRRVYWLHYILPLVAASIGAAVLDAILLGQNGHVLSAIVDLASLVPNLAASVKRCHDRSRSGWFLLVGLIPLVGQFWTLIEIGCLRGKPGPNRFGPDPLGLPRASFQYRPAPV